MKIYLAMNFLYLTMPLTLLFVAGKISHQRCDKRVRYLFTATLWLFCLLAYACVGCVQISLECRANLRDCYLDGITFSFMFWKDVLDFSYLGLILLAGLHLIYQFLRSVFFELDEIRRGNGQR